MKQLFKSFMGTVALVGGLVALLLLAKLIAMIPVTAITSLFLSNWPGLVTGIVVSYLGMGLGEFFSEKKRKKRRRNEDDEN